MLLPTSLRIAFLSACAFAVVVVLSPLAGCVMAVAGLCLLTVSCNEPGPGFSRLLSDLRLTACLIAVALIGMLVPYAIVGGARRWVPAALPLLTIGLGVAALAGWRRRYLVLAGVLVIATGALTGSLLIRAAGDAGIDVVVLHRSAAAALARGENIYGPAVTVANGAPGLPPGSMLVGYPYPPIVALAYAASTWLFGDPRWTNLAAWTVLIGCALALFARRQRPLLPFLLIAALPGWAAMLQAGWTEMLSSGLVGLAAVSWSNPALSGVVLGLALGSKQYFVVVLPLLLLHKDSRARRAPVALATAALTLLPAFIAGPGDAWRAMVLTHARRPPRIDSTNIAGALATLDIQWAATPWFAVGAAWIAVSFLALRARGASGFWRAFAGGLAVCLLLSTQAMPNYWYLVAVVVAIGLGSDEESNGPGRAASLHGNPTTS